ncbi:chemotaxis protein CheX [Clostridium cavendishii DSM 21758]|uniref:Chemotaxis protein CheX n=1 Tax=Clostridium cavendishii DSM 21758 TaxID=1121302 RepID=A0A1M6GBG5_9CLOT|nr:chemotaxis protein CheX [Clostridium cavendishii]SHJ07275.1 chemotaxis protein CheX [Clostridium cavendishii DSM 21758]
MKVEIINSFIKALESTLNENGGFVLYCKGKKALNCVNINKKVAIIIDLFGKSTIHGKVIITMKEEIAQKIIGFLLGGAVVSEIDSMGVSALGEYGSWVVSSATTNVQEFGEKITDFKVDIETNLEGIEDKEVYCYGKPFISLEYLIDNHDIELSVAVS